MPLHKYQQVAVDVKYQHEVQVSSRGPGVVYVSINNNRILFDSILQELNPNVVEKLASLWDSAEPTFHLNRNGQAALPDGYPWLSANTAPKALADIRLALQESTPSLPEPVKTAFLEKLAQDLTAPATRALNTIRNTYETHNSLYSITDPCSLTLSEALSQNAVNQPPSIEHLVQQLNTPANRDWTDSLMAVRTSNTLRQIYNHASHALDRAAAAIAHHPPRQIADAVFSDITTTLSESMDVIASPLASLRQKGLIAPGSPTDHVERLWHEAITNEAAQIQLQVAHDADTLTADLEAKPSQDAALPAIKEAIVLAHNAALRFRSGTNNGPDKHLQPAFNQYALHLSPTARTQAATELAGTMMSANHTRLNDMTDGLTSASPYRKSHPAVSELHAELTANLKENTRQAALSFARQLASDIYAGAASATVLRQHRANVITIAQQFKDAMINRHNDPQLFDDSLQQKHQDINHRLTLRIVQLFQEYITQQPSEHSASQDTSPTFRDLLSLWRHHPILEPFFRDYPQTDQLALISHMLDHPDET